MGRREINDDESLDDDFDDLEDLDDIGDFGDNHADGDLEDLENLDDLEPLEDTIDETRWPSRRMIELVGKDIEETAEPEWTDTGIREVPLNEVDLSDSPVKDLGDFRKVDHDEMADGCRRLEREVRPMVETGADSDYFMRRDAERGLDYEHGDRRIYDAFYGDSSIRLEKIGDSYNVVNGYHRLMVARELGMPSVPARVIERRNRN